MQTVLGANGQIADELARELHRTVTHDLRLVSRHPRRIHDDDQLVSADLTDRATTDAAVRGSDVAYLTVGLPMDSQLWERQFPTIMANVISACQEHDCRLVFFDNTYMYPRTAAPQTEETAFEPVGRKSRVRAQLATTLLQAMRTGQVDAMICRAPEFYGPGQTKSLTNSSIFDRIRRGRRALVPLDAETLRTLIWTPDASRAMALLGNTPDAYGQTWHLPCDDDRLSYRGMVETSAGVLHRRVGYRTVPAIAYRLGGLFNKDVKEAEELLPRYRQDNIFESTKFRQRFPDFAVTSYATGIRTILR